MAVFLVRALDLTATSGVTFSDVPPGHPFALAINRLATAGITTGCGGGRFCPGASVTRGRMAAFLARALDLSATSGVTFSDVRPATRSHWPSTGWRPPASPPAAAAAGSARAHR